MALGQVFQQLAAPEAQSNGLTRRQASQIAVLSVVLGVGEQVPACLAHRIPFRRRVLMEFARNRPRVAQPREIPFQCVDQRAQAILDRDMEAGEAQQVQRFGAGQLLRDAELAIVAQAVEQREAAAHVLQRVGVAMLRQYRAPDDAGAESRLLVRAWIAMVAEIQASAAQEARGDRTGLAANGAKRQVHGVPKHTQAPRATQQSPVTQASPLPNAPVPCFTARLYRIRRS